MFISKEYLFFRHKIIHFFRKTAKYPPFALKVVKLVCFDTKNDQYSPIYQKLLHSVSARYI